MAVEQHLCQRHGRPAVASRVRLRPDGTQEVEYLCDIDLAEERMGRLGGGRSLFDDGGDVIALTVVVVEGIIVVGITVALRSALRRAEESTASAEAARRELRFAVAVRDEVLRVWTEKVRGPLARLEITATDALHALERDGYRGPATQPLRSLLEDAGVLRRVTASWTESSFPAKTEET